MDIIGNNKAVQDFLETARKSYSAIPRGERGDFVSTLKAQLIESLERTFDEVDQIEYGEHLEGLYDISKDEIFPDRNFDSF